VKWGESILPQVKGEKIYKEDPVGGVVVERFPEKSRETPCYWKDINERKGTPTALDRAREKGNLNTRL